MKAGFLRFSLTKLTNAYNIEDIDKQERYMEDCCEKR